MMKAASHILKAFGPSRLWLPVAFAFLLINLLGIDDGGTNANARFATLRAMSDEFTFRIDNYHDWTMDWARTPDGHYYSNKAPGPTLLAFPVFFVIDRVLKPLQERHPDGQGRRQAPRGIHKVAISTLFQVLPFLVLALLCLSAAYPAGLTPAAYAVSLLAILFGNTAAVLMNSYMGNPFAGMAILGVAYFYLKERFGWASFFFGLAVLAEYSVAALALPFLVLAGLEGRKIGWGRMLGSVFAGASIPAALWAWYHTAAFGSPVSLPFQYEVTAVVGNVGDSSGGIWGGLTSLLPNPRWAFELLFGTSRGLLFTQPWILLVAFLGVVNQRLFTAPLKKLFWFSFVSLCILLWLNAGFPGWHGGGSPGPRYLSAVLPIFALFIPALFDGKGALIRWVFVISVSATVVFRGLVFATWILPPPEPIWPYYIRAIRTPKEWIELSVYFLVMAGAAIWSIKMAKSQNSYKLSSKEHT